MVQVVPDPARWTDSIKRRGRAGLRVPDDDRQARVLPSTESRRRDGQARRCRSGRTRSVSSGGSYDACFRIAEQERGFEAGPWPDLVHFDRLAGLVLDDSYWANAKADSQRSAAGSARSQCRLRDRGSARVRHTSGWPRFRRHPDGARGLHCTEVPLSATPERRGARCASRPRRPRRGPRRPLLRHGPPVPRLRAGPARQRPGPR